MKYITGSVNLNVYLVHFLITWVYFLFKGKSVRHMWGTFKIYVVSHAVTLDTLLCLDTAVLPSKRMFGFELNLCPFACTCKRSSLSLQSLIPLHVNMFL